MQDKMKAISFTAYRQVAVAEKALPHPAPGEVLLRVGYVAFCGSDLSTYLGKNAMVAYPRIPGHEIAATVASVAEGVPAWVTPGLPVTVVPYTNCGECSSCKAGRFNACRYNQTLGVQRDGAMAEYIAVPWQKLVAADGLTMEELALTEPLTVGFHAVDRGAVSANDTVMVMGCGMIGAGAIIGAASRGAKVIAVDIDDTKLELASAIGATHTLNAASQEFREELLQLTGGDGPNVVIEATGSAAAYRTATEEVAFAGRVVCIGYAKEDIAFTTRLWVQKELDIRGSRNATPADFEAVVAYLKKGGFPAERMISDCVTPERAADAMEKWAADPGKVMRIVVDFR